MATVGVRHNVNAGEAIKQGAIGGLLAGIVFAMFEMMMAAILNGAGAFFMPLRMIGAIVLGKQALDPSYSLLTAGATGLVVHMMLSVIFGMVVGAIIAYVPVLAASGTTLIVTTSVFGLLLWLVNFYLIAPVAGWNWFPDSTNPVVQFIAHTFFFGCMLGLFLNWSGRKGA